MKRLGQELFATPTAKMSRKPSPSATTPPLSAATMEPTQQLVSIDPKQKPIRRLGAMVFTTTPPVRVMTLMALVSLSKTPPQVNTVLQAIGASGSPPL